MFVQDGTKTVTTTIIFGTTIRSGALDQSNSATTPPQRVRRNLHPAFVASRLILSSLSPCDLTCPHNAKVVDVFKARPLASTSTMLICTDA